MAETGMTGAKWISTDPYVAALANKIESLYPGHVQGVNIPLRDAAGHVVTDADILLNNAVIQVKSGGGKGLGSQVLRKTPAGSGLPVIGYGPVLKPHVVQGIARGGGLVTTDESLLLEVIKPQDKEERWKRSSSYETDAGMRQNS